jgi:acyl-CoA thioesterase FadM
MARVKIDLPKKFQFTTTIPVRITDLNYAGHAGNDAILSIIHEARAQYVKNLGYSEMEFAGTGTIMSDVAIEFKKELFFGDTVIASVAVGEFTKVGFELVYKLEKEVSGKKIIVALAKTGMVCYDYEGKKLAAIPEEAKTKLMG